MKSRLIESIAIEEDMRNRQKRRKEETERKKNIKKLKEVHKKWLSKCQPTKPKVNTK